MTVANGTRSAGDDADAGRDDVVAAALASGWTHREAGALVGVSSKWVQRRLQDAAYRAEVHRRRTETLDAVVGQLGAIGPRAVAVVQAALEHDDPMIRLRAAIATLTTITKLGRQAEVEQRLAVIESRSVDAPRIIGALES